MGIWTDDLKFQKVETIEDALWHLKVMCGGIKRCASIQKQKKNRTDEEEFDLSTDIAQSEALAIAIDFIEKHLKGGANGKNSN